MVDMPQQKADVENRASGLTVPGISVVIPVYNSEKSLPILVTRVEQVLREMKRSFEIVLVDDCSSDGSWRVLKDLKAHHGGILRIAHLLRNCGQHNAVLCGLSLSRGEIVVTMDDDLQNPPEEIPKLINAVEQGYDLAIGAYDSKKHSAVRNKSGDLIDRVNRTIFGLPKDFQLTSFRAVRRVVVQNVCQMGGVFPYITSMLFSHTSRYINVPVRHEPRPFGKSNYNLKRSLLLASNLVFSYSDLPLKAMAILCGFAFLGSALFALYIIIYSIRSGTGVPGWASTIVVLSSLNSFILLSLLVFGMYISRINQQITRSRVSFTMGELHE
jgi:glycosyltransferase involved in cell wall biosynthesis